MVEGDDFVVAGNRIPISDNLKDKVHGTVKLGIRPEFFRPQFGSNVTGKISFVETQGREDLYNVTLADGSVLRSIQPAGPRLKLGEQVAWGISSDDVLAFTQEGARI